MDQLNMFSHQVDFWEYYRDKKKIFIEDFENINIWEVYSNGQYNKS